MNLKNFKDPLFSSLSDRIRYRGRGKLWIYLGNNLGIDVLNSIRDSSIRDILMNNLGANIYKKVKDEYK